MKTSVFALSEMALLADCSLPSDRCFKRLIKSIAAESYASRMANLLWNHASMEKVDRETLLKGVEELIQSDLLARSTSRAIRFDFHDPSTGLTIPNAKEMSGFCFNGVHSSIDCTIKVGACYICPDNRNSLFDGCRRIPAFGRLVDDNGKTVHFKFANEFSELRFFLSSLVDLVKPLEANTMLLVSTEQ